jgi:altronate hydrolase
MPTPSIQGFLRSDGRKGIRNHVIVVYLVECASHVAREIAWPQRHQGVHLIGFPGCYPNAYAERILGRICTHPNVGAVLLVSLGCESFNRDRLLRSVADSGRPAGLVVIQEAGGTAEAISRGQQWLAQAIAQIESCPRAAMRPDELVVATICGGSDATSGLTANPAVGRACDLVVQAGGTVIFENTGELIGCEQFVAARAATPELGRQIVACVEKAARYYTTLGHASFAPGNAEGGLTTIEEKSLGAYCKTGSSTIAGLLKPGDIPPRRGLWLLDIVPDGPVRFGFPNITDNAEIAELQASGCHATLFTTGRGSVVGSAIGPVVKVCANPDTFRRMRADMDINAGRILEGHATLDEVAREIFAFLLTVAADRATASETLGHQEFLLTYKSFEPPGPACMSA